MQNEDNGIGVKISERHTSIGPTVYSWRVAGREKERARKRFPRGKEVVHLLDMEQSGKEEEEEEQASSF